MLDYKVLKSIISDLQENIYTIKELAKKYHISEDTVRNLNKGLVKSALAFYDGPFPISDVIVPISKRVVEDYEKGMNFTELLDKYGITIYRLKNILKNYENQEA